MIDFVMWMEQTSRGSAGHMGGDAEHEALEKGKAMIYGDPSTSLSMMTAKPMNELPRYAVLQKVFTYFSNAVSMTKKAAQEYLESRGLDYKLLAVRNLAVGYNSVEMHHVDR